MDVDKQQCKLNGPVLLRGEEAGQLNAGKTLEGEASCAHMV